MRLLLAAMAVVLSLPATSVPAFAQAIKQVEVINFPDLTTNQHPGHVGAIPRLP